MTPLAWIVADAADGRQLPLHRRLVPQIRQDPSLGTNVLHFVCLLAALLLLYLLRVSLES